MRYSAATSISSLQTQLEPLIVKLREEEGINQLISAADPLLADEACAALPGLNKRGDSTALLHILTQLIIQARSIKEPDFIDTSAAIRDICMFGGSLVRFGIEPEDAVADFSATLIQLSAHIEAQIPRDSFTDYTVRNPTGLRERKFTLVDEEVIFIASLRQGMKALDRCVEYLVQAYLHPLASSEFAQYCQRATSAFQEMIDGIVKVRRSITPEAFTHNIRPYFEPFKVNGKAYGAPSGAEMSILNLDQILWGADSKEELYRTYFQANVARLPSVFRELGCIFEGQQPLVTLVKDRMTSGRALRADERASIKELHHFLTKLYSFRMPHYKVAEDNVNLRLRETMGEKEVKGSSGFGLAEVKYVLEQTIDARQVTSEALAS
jgi:monodechloroaminopyrrolnitrin synthase